MLFIVIGGIFFNGVYLKYYKMNMNRGQICNQQVALGV